MQNYVSGIPHKDEVRHVAHELVEMKGGHLQRARGKHFSFTLLTVVFTTIFLWSYERKPAFTAIIISSPDRLMLPSGLCPFAILHLL